MRHVNIALVAPIVAAVMVASAGVLTLVITHDSGTAAATTASVHKGGRGADLVTVDPGDGHEVVVPLPAAIKAQSEAVSVRGDVISTASVDDSELVDSLELAKLRVSARRARIYDSVEPSGQVGQWVGLLDPSEVPPRADQLDMAELLLDYPVKISRDEGLWLLERCKLGDWSSWGPSIDEAIIMKLDPARIASEVDEATLASLRSEWADEGYFAF